MCCSCCCGCRSIRSILLSPLRPPTPSHTSTSILLSQPPLVLHTCVLQLRLWVSRHHVHSPFISTEKQCRIPGPTPCDCVLLRYLPSLRPSHSLLVPSNDNLLTSPTHLLPCNPHVVYLFNSFPTQPLPPLNCYIKYCPLKSSGL